MAHKQLLIFLVIGGAMMMFILCLIVIFFVTQQRKKYLIQQHEIQNAKNESEQALLKAIISTQEEERTRIGLNLHDSVGAELSMVKLNLTRSIHYRDNGIDMDFFNAEMKNLDNTIENIRDICKDLYPKALQNYGFIAALGNVVARMNDSSLVNASFESVVEEIDLPFGFSEKLDLFRICQEILNNIIKHAKSTQLDVEINFLNDESILNIIFRHNGLVFTNDDAENRIHQSNGIGLKSIRNRINLIRGKINYLWRDNKTVIEIAVPIDIDQ